MRMLRHYDKLGLLKPGHVDEWSGYRYYEIEQLSRLHRILALRDLGLSLGQINTLLTEEALPQAQLQEMLRKKQREVEAALREEGTRLQRIDAHLRRLARPEPAPAYDVVLKKVPRQDLLTVRRVVPTLEQMPSYRSEMLQQLYRLIEIERLSPGQEVVAYHLQGYDERHIDMSVAVVLPEGEYRETVLLPPFEKLELPAASQVASIVHNGSILDIPEVVSELFLWLGVNGFASNGPYREIHLFGREMEVCADDVRTPVVFEILVPVESNAPYQRTHRS